MLNKNVHMRDQVNNRIEVIMQEGNASLWHHLEGFSIVVLLIAVFVLGVGV